jgi:hypothetical protein
LSGALEKDDQSCAGKKVRRYWAAIHQRIAIEVVLYFNRIAIILALHDFLKVKDSSHALALKGIAL